MANDETRRRPQSPRPGSILGLSSVACGIPSSEAALDFVPFLPSSFPCPSLSRLPLYLQALIPYYFYDTRARRTSTPLSPSWGERGGPAAANGGIP